MFQIQILVSDSSQLHENKPEETLTVEELLLESCL